MRKWFKMSEPFVGQTALMYMKARTSRQVPVDDDRERQLLARVARGERDAFDEVFRAYHPLLFRFVFKMTASYRLADEVANDILLIVWQTASKFRGDSKVSTWIFGIAYRQSLRRLGKRRLKTVPLFDSAAVDEQSASRMEREDWVRQAIALLPPKQRLTIMLVYYLGLTCDEAAKASDVPVSTVKTRMFHARRKLRGYLGDQS